MSEYPEAANLRKFLLRVNEGLLAQAEGVEPYSEDMAHTLRLYAGQLGKVADHVRYDGTVDWAEIKAYDLPGVALEQTLPQLAEELANATTELEERLDTLGVTDDEALQSTVNELEARVDSLEGP